jgi:hypothetical protein
VWCRRPEKYTHCTLHTTHYTLHPKPTTTHRERNTICPGAHLHTPHCSLHTQSTTTHTTYTTYRVQGVKHPFLQVHCPGLLQIRKSEHEVVFVDGPEGDMCVCVRERECVYIYMCMCVCVRERESVCTYICASVCERERKRERVNIYICGAFIHRHKTTRSLAHAHTPHSCIYSHTNTHTHFTVALGD